MLALALLMLWIGADNKNDTFAFHNLAIGTDFFD
jgi:hypothetical protein